MASRDAWILIGLFSVTLLVRLILAFQTPYLTDNHSYFWVRQAESIIATGAPLTHDDLSQGGRELLFPPVFAYLLAFAGLFGELAITGKILLNIIASTTIIFVYLASLHLTGSRHVSVLTGLMSAAIPAWISTTVTSLLPTSVVIPLFVLAMYAHLRLESSAWILAYLVSITLLAFLHPLALVFSAGLFAYFLISSLEGVSLRKGEGEVILFTILFMIWAAMIQYKKAILVHGPAVFWQNIPSPILNSYFTNVDILTTITSIGLVPFAAGIFITHRYLLRKQSLHATLIISHALTIGILLYLRIIAPPVGYPLFGLMICLVFPLGYQNFLSWLTQTRYVATHTIAPLAIFLLVLATSLIPGIALANSQLTASQIEMHREALDWLAHHTAPNATVLAEINEGDLITGVSHRRTMIDSDFLLLRDADQRYEAYASLLASPLLSTAVTILATYHVRYIYASPMLLGKISRAATWLNDRQCFSLLYDKNVKIYQVTCEIQHL